MRCAIGVRSVQTMAETFGAPPSSRVGAGAHRQLRERAGRQEVLERHVVVRMLRG